MKIRANARHSVGTYAVQLARYFGADVTGVCSTANVEMVKSLGANHVIDYTREDFTASGQTYDVIFDTVGKAPFSRCKHALTPTGIYIAGSGGLKEAVQARWTAITGGQRVIASASQMCQADLLCLKNLIEAGEIRPVIDRRYPLEQIVEAHCYVEKGHKKGNVVITVAQHEHHTQPIPHQHRRTRMKAMVYTQYGSPDVFRLQEVAKPVPKDNEVLVKIHATPVNFGDLIARNFGNVTPGQFTMPFPLWLPTKIAIGLRKPKQPILGSEFAGVVEATGKMVTRFQPGDAVFGYRGMNFGANAEYLCMSETGSLALKPGNMTFEEAASVPGGALTALSLLRKVKVQPGQRVLINGASGSIGSCALQLAKHFGAHVTGVCATPRVEMVRALGADQVIDYTREDFTQRGETYDLIFDVLGKSSFGRCKRVLNKNGRYLLVSFKMKQLFQMLWTSRFGSKKVVCALSNEKPEDLILIKELVEAGQIKTILDRCYPLEQLADAHRYVENGHKTGHVVITVAL